MWPIGFLLLERVGTVFFLIALLMKWLGGSPRKYLLSGKLINFKQHCLTLELWEATHQHIAKG